MSSTDGNAVWISDERRCKVGGLESRKFMTPLRVVTTDSAPPATITLAVSVSSS